MHLGSQALLPSTFQGEKKKLNMNHIHSVPHNQNLYFLLSQYELLERTSHHLSALDLFNLALTCHNLYSLILESPPVFNKLKRLTICSGQGLHKRQTFTGLYKPDQYEFIDQHMYGPSYDEEIEVRLFNIKCDTYNALPCLKCGVNICEVHPPSSPSIHISNTLLINLFKECRYVPRVRDRPFYKSRRRPHLDPAWERHTITCYCHKCDEKVKNTLPVRLSEVCDCDQYTRWICHSCRMKEERHSTYKTAQHWEGENGSHGIEEGLWLPDHQTMTAVCMRVDFLLLFF